MKPFCVKIEKEAEREKGGGKKNILLYMNITKDADGLDLGLKIEDWNPSFLFSEAFREGI